MSLMELTLRNVRRNFRIYTIYLLAMIAGVVIHFTFSSLMFKEDILSAMRNSANFQTGVMIASAAIFLFIIFFILYANSFFMKQRKKEIGLYLLLGMSESQVTRMLFYETIALGAVSLVSGILLGGLLSKWFGMLLMKLMEYDQTVSLSFPIEAIGTTVAVVLAIAVIISVQNLVMSRRVQLVELFRAKAAMEKPPRISAWLALLAVLLLGEAYGLIIAGRGSYMWVNHAQLSLALVAAGIIAGTWLFFRQFTGWMLLRLQKRARYFEGNQMLWTSALRFRTRSSAMNLSFITLFSAALILLTSFVAINYSVQFTATAANLPNDIAFESLGSGKDKELDQLIRSSTEHPVTDYRALEAIRVTPGTGMESAFENAEYFETEPLLVPQSVYQAFIEFRGDEERVQLSGNEAVALSQGRDMSVSYSRDDAPAFPIQSGSNAIELSIVALKDYALLGWASDPLTSMSKKPAVLVVTDEVYNSLRQGGAEVRTYHIYEIEDAGNAEQLSAQVHAVVKEANPNAYYSSFSDVYSKQIEGSSLMLFSAAFLAVIALFTLASVIYFNQLREATEEQRQYSILRKIGVQHRHIVSTIRKQLLFVFAPPLVLGLLHSWLIIDSYILESVQGYEHITGIIAGTMLAYFLIYFLLYSSAVNVYSRIVNRKP
ncbi:ABC transporter permease [Paenibacillus nanensis]|uniref:ABC transporter permease n=1 Tax=Paenibacillus nanensis TaxID=393251 RepID=A0A3A1UWM8_9BACL|nr:ABC transporter permease [Paenibacillus nanensis]RIX50733.1 ABC transporter permease [Paenibacillus nanensis]